MGDYHEEFIYWDLPTYYRDSKKRHHLLDGHGRHLDSCLLHDIAAKVAEICLVDRVDASAVKFSVVEGMAFLKGRVDDDASLKFIIGAIDSMEGIKGVRHQIRIAAA